MKREMSLTSLEEVHIDGFDRTRPLANDMGSFSFADGSIAAGMRRGVCRSRRDPRPRKSYGMPESRRWRDGDLESQTADHSIWGTTA